MEPLRKLREKLVGRLEALEKQHFENARDPHIGWKSRAVRELRLEGMMDAHRQTLKDIDTLLKETTGAQAEGEEADPGRAGSTGVPDCG